MKKYRIEKVFDGYSCYYQLVRKNDGAILCAYRDIDSIWQMVSFKEVEKKIYLNICGELYKYND